MSRLATLIATYNFGAPWCLSPSHPEPLASQLLAVRATCLERRARISARLTVCHGKPVEGVRYRLPVIALDDDMTERK